MEQRELVQELGCTFCIPCCGTTKAPASWLSRSQATLLPSTDLSWRSCGTTRTYRLSFVGREWKCHRLVLVRCVPHADVLVSTAGDVTLDI